MGAHSEPSQTLPKRPLALSGGGHGRPWRSGPARESGGSEQQQGEAVRSAETARPRRAGSAPVSASRSARKRVAGGGGTVIPAHLAKSAGQRRKRLGGAETFVLGVLIAAPRTWLYMGAAWLCDGGKRAMKPTRKLNRRSFMSRVAGALPPAARFFRQRQAGACRAAAATATAAPIPIRAGRPECGRSGCTDSDSGPNSDGSGSGAAARPAPRLLR